MITERIRTARAANAIHATKKFMDGNGLKIIATNNATHDVKQKPQNNGLRVITFNRARIPRFNAGKVFSVSFQINEIMAMKALYENNVKNIVLMKAWRATG
jgi:hypothetical protein